MTSSYQEKRACRATCGAECGISNVPLIGHSIHVYNSAILLHGISKGAFRLFNIDNNSIYPGSTVARLTGLGGFSQPCPTARALVLLLV